MSQEKDYQTYLNEINAMMSANDHVEAGTGLKGVWPKDFVPLDKWSELEKTGFVDFLLRLVKKQVVNLLDVGGGNGSKSIPLALYLAKFGKVNFTLIDMQSEAIDLAKGLLSKIDLPTNLNTNLIQAKMIDFSTKKDSFDGVLLQNVLHFVETDEAILSLRKLSKNIRKDGILCGSVCSIYNASCVGQNDSDRFEKMMTETKGGVLSHPYKSLHRRYGDMYFYTENSLREVLFSGGFELKLVEEVSNEAYPNGMGESYKENIVFVARKI